MPRQREDILACRGEECETTEQMLEGASSAAMRRFLQRIKAECALGLRRYAPIGNTLSAAALPNVNFDLFSLAEVRAWWAESLGEDFLPALSEAWRRGYYNETTLETGLDAVPAYLASVRDRLVPGIGPMTTPEIPDDAFNMARGVINRALATGDGPKELARALSATFSWDQDQAYWEATKAAVDVEIDAQLDPLGPPGTAAREAAKDREPVLSMIQDRNIAQSRIDAVQSTWQVRATRIARTESTGALNAGALAAMQEEGVACVEWLSTRDARTRPSHQRLNGQKVALGTLFSNGCRMPGDPTCAASEVVNCRCALLSCEVSELPPASR